jgi:hypothetical protein
MQVQSSDYIKIDDNFMELAEWVRQDMKRNIKGLNKYQQEERLFE